MIGIAFLRVFSKLFRREKEPPAKPAAGVDFGATPPTLLLAPLYCSPAEAAEKLAAWDDAAKKFGADQLEQYREPELLPASHPAAFPVPSFQLPTPNSQLPSCVTGFVLPSGLAKSMVDGGPLRTPCGRPCRVGVIYVARPASPDRVTWVYLPCTERQARDVATCQCLDELISLAELWGVWELLNRQRERTACDCKESRP
jgi:hypothetical protein